MFEIEIQSLSGLHNNDSSCYSNMLMLSVVNMTTLHFV